MANLITLASSSTLGSETHKAFITISSNLWKTDQRRWEVVHQLLTGGRIRGNGFQLQNSQVAATIVSSFGLPHRASKSCLKWEDLTSFDLDFFCEDIEDVPRSINVTVEPFISNVKGRINFISEQILRVHPQCKRSRMVKGKIGTTGLVLELDHPCQKIERNWQPS
ncbi:hypothetical protein COCNU_08G001250 [Cocos nucifera]|uniref:Uncharacterized protein n=1 Tax=Cocos nucifera TaxID=13894 RepID=A0A8K0N5W1_COCNU|nr:hypothetical protein COCNU_08G001250 [Cocos nucifera]